MKHKIMRYLLWSEMTKLSNDWWMVSVSWGNNMKLDSEMRQVHKRLTVIEFGKSVISMWCHDNCGGAFEALDKKVFFQNEADASLFTMTVNKKKPESIDTQTAKDMKDLAKALQGTTF